MESGVIVTAGTIEELAQKTGLPEADFLATVERFNGLPARVSTRTSRGESAYDRYYGDPTKQAQPESRRDQTRPPLRGQDGAG